MIKKNCVSNFIGLFYAASSHSTIGRQPPPTLKCVPVSLIIAIWPAEVVRRVISRQPEVLRLVTPDNLYGKW